MFTKFEVQEFMAGRKVFWVLFKKKNGGRRWMKCTIDGSLIPESKYPKGVGSSFSVEVQRVFDLEAQEWRSFRYDSVLELAGE